MKSTQPHFLFLSIVMLSVTSSCGGQSFFEADHPFIHYSGRVDFSDSKKAVYDWPGVYITTFFEGPELTLFFQDQDTRYDIFIDDKWYTTLVTEAGITEYFIADNLMERIHRLKIGKRTESHTSESVFLGIKLGEGKGLREQAESRRRIEFIGDSLMAAYGCESPGRVGDHDDYVRYTNTNKSFCTLTASAFNAEYHINAISGKGLARNSAGKEAGFEYLRYYDKTLISPVNREDKNQPEWDFSSWQPQVVVIGLGTNDFAGDTVPPPSFETFERKYFQLLDTIRSNYGEVSIIALALPVWPHLTYRGYMKKIVAKARNRGFDIHYHEYKVDMSALHWHPSVEEHQYIAEGLIRIIEQVTPFSISHQR